VCARGNVAKLPKIGERLDAVRFKKALPQLVLDPLGFDLAFVIGTNIFSALPRAPSVVSEIVFFQRPGFSKMAVSPNAFLRSPASLAENRQPIPQGVCVGLM